MPNLYVVLRSGEEAWLVEWSTVMDAPNAPGVPIDECDRSDPQVLRALRSGTSAIIPPGTIISGEANIVLNRAGKDETVLTVEEIVEHYCRRRGEGQPPRGWAPGEHSKQQNEDFIASQYRDLQRRRLDRPHDFTMQRQ